MTSAHTLKLPNNEGKCLDATLRVLERTRNAIRADLSFPEKMGGAHPVELVCRIGGLRYALEHTRVEAFHNQIGDGFNFAGMTDGLSAELEGKLPANGLYQLILSVGATTGIKHHEVPHIRARLAKWILDAAHRLESKGDRGAESETPEGVPFSADLRWQRWSAPTKLFAARGINEISIEKDRVTQMMKGISSKLSKLKGWAELGAIDVLVLENWDAALSNFPFIRSAFTSAIQHLGHVPSHVYCVDTYIHAQWTVWSIRRDGVAEQTQTYWDFLPNELGDPRSCI
ncbi:MAG TPA: hypothetical protein VHE58_04575 [Burkholderiales bacterium]|nr:hypothetical protein [Burkholderiales bacterium]